MKRAPLALTFLLFVTPALADPSLRGEVTVTAALVTVGDMFDNPGPLSETAIFRAPAPGTTGIVDLASVEQAAAMIGLTDFDNVGFTRVRVARASTLVDATVLDKLVEDNLARKGIVSGSVTAAVRFSDPDLAFNAEAVEQPATLLDLRYTPGNGAFAGRFLIAGIDQPVDLTGSIELMTTAPRLIASTAGGTILTEADFEMATVPLATADAGGFADLQQLVGKQLLRQSRAGLMLKPTDVAEPSAVTRNTLVTVVLRTGAMTLTIKGTALGTVAEGEPVDVLNAATKKILHGVARSDGSVEIVTATTMAAL
jgi:flagella basal body P-ring formation protein FlgA